MDAGQRARRPSEAAADRAAARAAAARVEAYLAQQAVAASSVTRQGGKQSRLGQARGQQLGEAELRALAELFDDLDTDHTGSLDLKQFRSLLTLLAQRVAARDVDGVVYGLREAHTIFAASDLDSSGSLDFPEFIALLADASGGLAIDAGMGHKIGQAVLREAMDGVQGRKSVLGSLEETSRRARSHGRGHGHGREKSHKRNRPRRRGRSAGRRRDAHEPAEEGAAEEGSGGPEGHRGSTKGRRSTHSRRAHEARGQRRPSPSLSVSPSPRGKMPHSPSADPMLALRREGGLLR